MAVLRNPTDRVYSHFQMSCQRDKKSQQYRLTKVESTGKRFRNISGVFREGKIRHQFPYCTPADFDIFLRLKGPGNPRGVVAGIFKTGMYADDLLRWRHEFPGNTTLVLFTEELKADPHGFFDDIQQFLGIPYHNYTAETASTDEGYTVLVGQQTKVKDRSHHYDMMSADAREKIDAFYRGPNIRLMQLLMRDFPPGWPRPLHRAGEADPLAPWPAKFVAHGSI